MKTHTGKRPIRLNYPLDPNAERWFYHSFTLPDGVAITDVSCILSGVEEVVGVTEFGTIVIDSVSYPNVWGVKVQALSGYSTGQVTFRFTTAVGGDADLGEVDDRTVQFAISHI